MKLLRVIPATIALLGTIGCLQAASTPTGKTVVIFDHPENFTDVKDRDFATESGQADILNQLKAYIIDVGNPRLPPGDTLTITFTDIKLAGSFEPWHGPDRQDIRYVRDIYPPAYKYTYVVTDASGKVLRQAAVDDHDLTFQTRIVIDQSDPRHYEKAYLNDAVRTMTQGLK